MELLSIGELARRTGLTVKTVRFYADRGIVPPADRSPAGYRRYHPDAVARLELVRTLRELGLDLDTIRRVADRESTLAEVAAAHTEALDVRIRTLRLRRAVLSAAARYGSTPKEVQQMRELAELSARERRALIDDFLAQVFGDLDGFDGIARSLTPELPDDPEPAQIEAWIELAGLARDPAFRDGLRLLAERHAADRDPTVLRRDPVALVRDEAGPALAAGLDPASAQAGPVVAAVLARYPVRDRLVAQLEAARDPRRERYLELLSVVNGWPAPESLAPVLGWFLAALRSR
ncbi:MerR family transcriptional regulator [Actinoplanes sp. ATCC 53533]|uniref:MerR family transcriptional regulator n=1 Tax=Actinoplanes sp. ATCC 53533 TaxID=1288362 RepID=UPI000F793C9D|nr:MerR family transcriptional regulator [Actinoplanes sp. ATCC 53533]RSM58425.1 MerR family transcriptional regulator [Actinoplanes sp. ATCC 53533]